MEISLRKFRAENVKQDGDCWYFNIRGSFFEVWTENGKYEVTHHHGPQMVSYWENLDLAGLHDKLEAA